MDDRREALEADYEEDDRIDYSPSSKKIPYEKEKEICEEAQKRAKHWFEVFSDNIASAKENLNFALGDQWDAGLQQTYREMQQNPRTANKVYPIIRQIIGEIIEGDPDIQIASEMGRSEEEVVNFYQDYLNTVSYHSEGRIVWKHAAEYAYLCGFSWVKVCNDYDGEESLEQQMYLEHCHDITKIFADPSAKKESKQDGEYWGEVFDLSESEFIAQNPEVDLSSIDGAYYEYGIKDKASVNAGITIGRQVNSAKRVTVMVYQRKEWYQEKYIEAKSGKLWTVPAYEEAFDAYIDKQIAVARQRFPDVPEKILVDHIKKLRLPKNLEYVRKVKRAAYKIRCYKICGNKILEHSDWISKYGGYVFVDCNSHWYEGKQRTRPFIVDAKDSQVLLNTAVTKIQYYMALMRGERYIGIKDHIAGYENQWRRVDAVQGILLYNPVVTIPGVSSRPEEIAPQPIDQSLFQVAAYAEESIYTSLGLGQAWRGQSPAQRRSEGSLKNEIIQSDKTTILPSDGLFDAMTQVGKVLLDAAPKILDTNRIMNLISKTGESKEIEINAMDNEGNMTMDLTKAKYTLCVKPGVSFEKQRERIFALISQMGVAGPQHVAMAADKLAENIPFPGSNILSRRYKAMIPPQILAAGEGKELPPPPPEPPNPMIELEMKKLEQKNQELEVKKEALMIDIERMRAEMLKLQQNMQLQYMKANAEMEKVGVEFQQHQENRIDRQEDRLIKTLESLSKLGANVR